MSAPPPFPLTPRERPPRFEAVRTGRVREAAAQWVRRRPYTMMPAYLAGVGMLLASGYPVDRVRLAAAAYVSLGLYILLVAVRVRVREVDERELFHGSVAITITHGVALTLTGGLASPFLPFVIGAPLAMTVMFGRSRESRLVLWLVVGVCAAQTLMPSAWLDPPVPRPWSTAITLLGLSHSIVIMRLIIYGLTDIYWEAGETIERMREEVLAASAERLRSLESIGARVAHELKNPLSAVKGLVQLLSRAVPDDRSRARLDVIQSEVTRMEAILRDYLSFSRPLDILRPQPVPLRALVDEVIAVLEARASGLKVRLTSSGAGSTVEGDPRRLKEALLNLVTNALEATPPGGSVNVDVQPTELGAKLVVRDTGRGIGAEDLQRLGTPFFTLREGGTGLGVVLVRAVVHQHGGDVRYESQPNKGTIVTVTLPRRVPLPGGEATPQPAA